MQTINISNIKKQETRWSITLYKIAGNNSMYNFYRIIHNFWKEALFNDTLYLNCLKS